LGSWSHWPAFFTPFAPRKRYGNHEGGREGAGKSRAKSRILAGPTAAWSVHGAAKVPGSRARRCRTCSTAAPTCPAAWRCGIVPLVLPMRRSRQRRRAGLVEYRRTGMRSDLAKIAPAASARGKNLGPCGDEVSGHGGARQHRGLRRDGCGVRPASLRYGQERRCGT
jgi:hypothetical protein